MKLITNFVHNQDFSKLRPNLCKDFRYESNGDQKTDRNASKWGLGSGISESWKFLSKFGVVRRQYLLLMPLWSLWALGSRTKFGNKELEAKDPGEQSGTFYVGNQIDLLSACPPPAHYRAHGSHGSQLDLFWLDPRISPYQFLHRVTARFLNRKQQYIIYIDFEV